MGREVYLSSVGRTKDFGSFEVWIDMASLVYTYNGELLSSLCPKRDIYCPKLQTLKVE